MPTQTFQIMSPPEAPNVTAKELHYFLWATHIKYEWHVVEITLHVVDETMENKPMITQNWHEQYRRQFADNVKLNDALAKEHALRLKSENLLRKLMTHIHTVNLDMGGGNHQYHLKHSGWPVVTKIKAWLAEH